MGITKEQFTTLALADYIELGLDVKYLEEINFDEAGGTLMFSCFNEDFWIYRCNLYDNGSRHWFKWKHLHGWEVLCLKEDDAC